MVFTAICFTPAQSGRLRNRLTGESAVIVYHDCDSITITSSNRESRLRFHHNQLLDIIAVKKSLNCSNRESRLRFHHNQLLDIIAVKKSLNWRASSNRESRLRFHHNQLLDIIARLRNRLTGESAVIANNDCYSYAISFVYLFCDKQPPPLQVPGISYLSLLIRALSILPSPRSSKVPSSSPLAVRDEVRAGWNAGSAAYYRLTMVTKTPNYRIIEAPSIALGAMNEPSPLGIESRGIINSVDHNYLVCGSSCVVYVSLMSKRPACDVTVPDFTKTENQTLALNEQSKASLRPLLKITIPAATWVGLKCKPAKCRASRGYAGCNALKSTVFRLRSLARVSLTNILGSPPGLGWTRSGGTRCLCTAATVDMVFLVYCPNVELDGAKNVVSTFCLARANINRLSTRLSNLQRSWCEERKVSDFPSLGRG
ncbi:hypothetical protein J6590_085084 [Homalodisca vitripennis]|nr:hypothetical protein J6590_085084 [Homalodisca vitripennis]